MILASQFRFALFDNGSMQKFKILFPDTSERRERMNVKLNITDRLL